MEGNGELKIGDLVLVRGRWTFDAGHKGHNEIHAVSTIQKIPDVDPKRPASPPPGSPATDIDNFYRVWCELADQAPPDHEPGQRPADMTPAQTQTFECHRESAGALGLRVTVRFLRSVLTPQTFGRVPVVRLVVPSVGPAGALLS